MTQPPLTPGARIGRYALRHMLGEGGMGVVYAAYDDALDRQVAIKMLREGGGDSHERMRREARTLASVNHPAVCQVYEIGVEQGQLFIVMELLDGESLGQRVARGPIPPGEALPIGASILGALETLHRRGIIHRDLKPSNVFLTPHGVKLLDFGLARATLPLGGVTDPTLTVAGTIVGTPRYMAPEQWSAGTVGPAADLFAAGAVLFETLAGRPAFHGESVLQLYHAVMHDQPPALTGDAGIVALDGVIRRALAKRAEDRFPSAAAMAAELAEAGRRLSDGSSPRVRAMTRLMVLPFRVLRPDPEIDFLAYSLPDAITMSLTGLDSLVIRSSAASARYASENPDLRAIGKEAEVDAVLIGTLLRAGDQVRVAAQLVETPSGTVVSSKTAQVALRDIFQLQDELTREIVAALTIPLSVHDASQLRRDVPASARAYEFYLRANELARDPGSITLAREMYRSCLAEDPGFAPAWARLARVCRMQAKYGPDDDSSAALVRQAEEGFGKALAISPDLALAHNLFTPFEIEELGRAEQAMVRLLERARTRTADPELYCGLVMACRYTGLVEASLAADERARRLDPAIPTSVAYTYWMLGDFEKVLARWDGDLFVSAYALSASGRQGEAIANCFELERRFADTTSKTAVAALAGLRAAIEQDRPAALESVDDMMRSRFRDPEGIYFMARGLARVGEHARALAILAQVVDGGYACVLPLRADSWLDPIRSEPEFGKVLARAEDLRRRGVDAYTRAGGEAVLGVPAG